MIDFRYHLVSLISVFLALAVGIALGAGPLKETIGDTLTGQVEVLRGERETDAFAVRCDRTTMTQDDIDNGRLICLIGVAPTYPAEFVIFRIGQWTADRKI